MDSLSEMTHVYSLSKEQLRRHILDVLIEEDPMGLIYENPTPLEEYVPEAGAIAERLDPLWKTGKRVNGDQAAAIVAEVFEQWFEERPEQDVARRVGETIFA